MIFMIGVFRSQYHYVGMLIFVFKKKPPFSAESLRKNAEICDHNIDPWSYFVRQARRLRLQHPRQLRGQCHQDVVPHPDRGRGRVRGSVARIHRQDRSGAFGKSLPSRYVCVSVRATRLGENSPNGWLISLGSFCVNYRKSPHFWTSFFHWKNVWINVGYILGDFFTNSSGHPGVCLLLCVCLCVCLFVIHKFNLASTYHISISPMFMPYMSSTCVNKPRTEFAFNRMRWT
jgi:hypothetical protein